MLINKLNKQILTRSDFPNSNWLNDDNYIVVNDLSTEANEILENYPYVEIIISNNALNKIIIKKEEKEKELKKSDILSKIKELKTKLNETDYQAIKFAEGQIFSQEYEPIKIQRQNWRNQINELEAELNK